MSRQAAIASALLALCSSVTLARPASEHDLLPSYDYIVVGGGTSGLTVANRLSEDSNVTVLVIEAGPFDENEDFIRIPGLAGGGIGSRYDWNISYAPNDVLGGQVFPVPQGKVVGGNTKINIMTFDRGSRSDYDRWETLGLQGWNWDSFLQYFRKTESFTPAISEIATEYNITVDPKVHGYDGYVRNTYSPFYWPTTRNFVDAFRELNIHIPEDAGNGDAYGGYFTPHNQDPVTATRCSAREAYYDTAKNRSNFRLLPNAQVTRLLTTTQFGNVSIFGVEYASSNTSSTNSILVNREVILAAGVIHTPQLLQVSGIGDQSLLTSLNITTVVDLPAVGQNFHDHVHFRMQGQIIAPLTQSNLSNNATFAAEARALYDTERRGPYARAGGDFLGYLPLTTYSDAVSRLQEEAAAQNVSTFLVAGTPPEVLNGYRAVHDVLTERLSAPNSALIEFGLGDGNVGLSLQAPFSRGSIRAVSSSMFDDPIVDPRALHNPLDISLLVEGIKYARTVMLTDAISVLQPREIAPGANVTSDADLASYVTQNASPAWHLAGSCKMSRREDGGVVDEQLKVYGVNNLRVVDASIMPFLPASHPMTTVYAVAEKISFEDGFDYHVEIFTSDFLESS